MTLVTGFATSSFAVLVADRRRSNLKTNERLDDILKIRRLNNRVAVGYSSIYEMTDDGLVIGLAETIMEQVEQQTRDPRCTVESIAHLYKRAINSLMEQGMTKEQLEVTFHIVGESVNGGFALGRVSVFEDFEPVITVPQNEGLTWGLSRADYSPTDWLVARIAELEVVTLETVQKLAVRLVEHTAQQDEYVSGTYDMLTLEKG